MQADSLITMKPAIGIVLGSVIFVASHCPAAVYRSVMIEDVPHIGQKPDFCGEACAAMWLQKQGHDVTQDDVFNASGLDPLAARGCHSADLVKGLRALNVKVGDVWYRSRPGKGGEAQWLALHHDLIRGIPSIVCMRTSEGPNATEHFRLILGYDAATDEVVYHEPSEKNGAEHRMKRATLFKLWPLKSGAEEWTRVRIALDAARTRVPKRSTGHSAADYAQHVMGLKKRLPSNKFSIALSMPFVVIGDETPERVARHATNTIAWAVRHLKAMYFERDPAEIMEIWLFKDKASYEKHTWEVFRERPTTPFGYNSANHNALIMNIATGGGTLVHEIVHPFVAANFPACPAWFNEGLGSLYEQCSGRDNQIVGLTNWRLNGLKVAIAQKRLPSFRALMSTTTHAFYRPPSGLNYAQARYLLYFLQEKGLLVKYYNAFREAHADDPTGYDTLQSVLGTKDLAVFQKRWEVYVLLLKYP